MVSDLVPIIISIVSAAASIALVLILYRAVKMMEATVKLSQVQTEFKLRPWIGPTTGFKRSESSINEDIQFEVTVKNFGEIPASAVYVKFVSDSNMINRQTILSESQFALGPILPNMKKTYWFFIKKERWDKVVAEEESLFTGVYFEYLANSKQNGYGMISEYVQTSQNFVHKDMWVHNPDFK